MTEKRRKVKHVYTLRFDNGPDQTVKAYGPTQAVLARKGERLPYQITDETLVNLWLTAGRAARAAERAAQPLPKPEYHNPDDAHVLRYSDAAAQQRAVNEVAPITVERARRLFEDFIEDWDA